MRKLIYPVVVVLLFVAGCDPTVDPVKEDTYSVYGYLDLSEKRQFIRVKALNEPLLADAHRKMEATVALRDLAAGRRHLLQDSVILFTDENDTLYTHNFWTDVAIKPKTEYRLTVSRGGNIVTTASTRTPTNAEASINPQEGNCLTTFDLRFREASERPLRVFGGFYYDGRYHEIRLDEIDGVPIKNPDGGDPFMQITPEHDLLAEEIPKKEQIDLPFDPRYIPRCLDLDDDTLDFWYVYASSNWEDLLPDPSKPADLTRYIEETRVENGHGFFGAINRGDLTVTVDTSDTLGTKRSF